MSQSTGDHYTRRSAIPWLFEPVRYPVRLSSVLTSDIQRGWLTLDQTGTRPSDTFALELVLAKVLLDLVSRHVKLRLDYPRSGVRIDKLRLLRAYRPFSIA